MNRLGQATIQIRKAAKGDLSHIAFLCQQLDYQVNTDEVGQRLNKISADSRQLVLVAIKATKLVGWIHVFIADRIESESFAEIGGLVVDKDHRKLNIGSMLFEHASAWVKSQANRKLRVRCADQRKQAHDFYLAQGMKQTKTQYIFDKTLR